MMTPMPKPGQSNADISIPLLGQPNERGASSSHANAHVDLYTAGAGAMVGFLCQLAMVGVEYLVAFASGALTYEKAPGKCTQIALITSLCSVVLLYGSLLFTCHLISVLRSGSKPDESDAGLDKAQGQSWCGFWCRMDPRHGYIDSQVLSGYLLGSSLIWVVFDIAIQSALKTKVYVLVDFVLLLVAIAMVARRHVLNGQQQGIDSLV